MRRILAVKIEPPVFGLETVGELLGFLGCQWCFWALCWLLVWPA